MAARDDMRGLACLLATMIAAEPAMARVWVSPENLSEHVTAVAVMVDDEVKGQCLLNPNAAGNAMKASLSRAGIRIDEAADFVVSIGAVGYRTSDGLCAVTTRLRLFRVVVGWGFLDLANSLFLYTAPRNIDQLLMADVQSFADELATAFMQARLSER